MCTASHTEMDELSMGVYRFIFTVRTPFNGRKANDFGNVSTVFVLLFTNAPSARMREGYCSCLVCVCVSVCYCSSVRLHLQPTVLTAFP